MHLPPGAVGILISFSVPEEKVLLSQFEMWTWVLNDYYIVDNEKENARVKQLGRMGRLTDEMRTASWERIFDLSFGSAGFWACCSELRIDQVKEARRFVAR
jgi:hypothetical protein